jgi:hypothetical protein
LGYLLIARTSILDIKMPSGEPYGVGLDAAYKAVARYFLNSHERHLKKKLRDEFYEVFRADQVNAPIVFLSTVNYLLSQGSPPDEERAVKDELLRIRASLQLNIVPISTS